MVQFFVSDREYKKKQRDVTPLQLLDRLLSNDSCSGHSCDSATGHNTPIVSASRPLGLGTKGRSRCQRYITHILLHSNPIHAMPCRAINFTIQHIATHCNTIHITIPYHTIPYHTMPYQTSVERPWSLPSPALSTIWRRGHTFVDSASGRICAHCQHPERATRGRCPGAAGARCARRGATAPA